MCCFQLIFGKLKSPLRTWRTDAEVSLHSIKSSSLVLSSWPGLQKALRMTSTLFLCPFILTQRLQIVTISTVQPSPYLTHLNNTPPLSPALPVPTEGHRIIYRNSRHRALPNKFYFFQWCCSPVPGPRLLTSLAYSSCCVHCCRNISNVLQCTQHLVKQLQDLTNMPSIIFWCTNL